MNSLQRNPGWLALICLWCCFGSSLQAQQYARPSGRPAAISPSSSRMRVVEMGTAPATAAPTYSIVGAVARSGVYIKQESSLTVGQLIDAAGGLASGASSTVRVVRNGEMRYQVHLSADSNAPQDRLLPGDIVVVPYRTPSAGEAPLQTDVTPVACVGLLDHPVVLPLDASIRTLDQLVQALRQHPEVAHSATLIDPTRGSATNQLACGCVVVFNPQVVDRLPFQQAGALPSPIPLDLDRTSATPHAVPNNVELPPPVPAVQMTQQLSADMIAPPQSHSIQMLPEDSPTIVSHAAEIPDSSRPIERTSGERTSFPAPMLPLPTDLAHAIDLFAKEVDSSQPTLIEQQSAELVLPGEAEPTPALRSLSAETAPTIPQRTLLRTANNAAELVAPQSQINDLAGAIVAGSPMSSGQDRQKSMLQYLLFCGAGLSILIGASLLLSLLVNGGSVFPAASPAAINSQSHIAAIPAAVESQPIRPSSGPAVEALLKRAIPLVEEPIQVPSAWPLHGQVIGHRRVILNSAHEGVAAPHFASRKKSPSREKISVGSAKAAERHLRQNLREICQQSLDIRDHESLLEDSLGSAINTPELKQDSPAHRPSPSPSENSVFDASDRSPTPASGSSAIKPQEPAPAASEPPVFDIVLPQTSAHIAAMSPLERALRTLASEKRG